MTMFRGIDQGPWSFYQVHDQLYTLLAQRSDRSHDLKYSLTVKLSHTAPRILGRISWQSFLWEVLCSGVTFMREVRCVVPRLLKKEKKRARQTVVPAWHM